MASWQEDYATPASCPTMDTDAARTMVLSTWTQTMQDAQAPCETRQQHSVDNFVEQRRIGEVLSDSSAARDSQRDMFSSNQILMGPETVTRRTRDDSASSSKEHPSGYVHHFVRSSKSICKAHRFAEKLRGSREVHRGSLCYQTIDDGTDTAL